MKLLLFGNPALEYDNLALAAGRELEKEGYDVLHVENPFELTELDLDECVILDVAEGVGEPTLFENLDKLVLGRLCTLHDFDMAFFLKLLKELGTLKRARIIALPMRASESSLEAFVQKIRLFLHNL